MSNNVMIEASIGVEREQSRALEAIQVIGLVSFVTTKSWQQPPKAPIIGLSVEHTLLLSAHCELGSHLCRP